MPIESYGTYVQNLHASKENTHDLGPDSTQILDLLMQHYEDKNNIKTDNKHSFIQIYTLK